MAQNIYDNEEFFEGYSRLPRSVEGLDGAPEWPALRALLPDLRGLDVLDLGCGFGWFCRWARGQGAAINTLLRHGFAISHVEEWGPTEEQIGVPVQIVALNAILAKVREYVG
jgi:SAM-dependent methyltransferase